MCSVQLVLAARCALKLHGVVAGTLRGRFPVGMNSGNHPSVIRAADELLPHNTISFPVGKTSHRFCFCSATFSLSFCGAPAQHKGGDKPLIRRGMLLFLTLVEVWEILQHFLREKTLKFSPIANCVVKWGNKK